MQAPASPCDVREALLRQRMATAVPRPYRRYRRSPDRRQWSGRQTYLTRDRSDGEWWANRGTKTVGQRLPGCAYPRTAPRGQAVIVVQVPMPIDRADASTIASEAGFDPDGAVETEHCWYFPPAEAVVGCNGAIVGKADGEALANPQIVRRPEGAGTATGCPLTPVRRHRAWGSSAWPRLRWVL